MPNLLNRQVPSASSLPKVHARKVEEGLITGVNDKQAESFGFNSGHGWDRPESYVRWIPPIDSDRDKQVEYDMDQQDREWLDSLNAQRRQEGIDTISYEFFEILMDRLEKEWFDLTKRFPKPQNHLPVDDGKCAVCDDGECENSNAIVFCDGCNLAVHQDCYGVPYIPEGQWLCRKCTVSPDKPVSCVLCPAEFGAFKQTTTGSWAHLLCAIWVPETGVSNTVYMEPIDGIDLIPKSRWKLVCYLCKKRGGACIQCSNRNCFTAFHVTCARNYGLYLKLQATSAHYDGPSENRAYCHKHMPRTEIEGNSEADESNVSAISRSRKSRDPTPPAPIRKRLVGSTSKSSRAYQKSYSFGPPVIPKFIFDRIWAYIDRIKIRKKSMYVEMVCRYWSLKREMRRGAPLLKRLHLEPWTATTVGGSNSDADKARKLQLIIRLRQDLEKVRMLADFVRKREKEKLKKVQLLDSFIEDYYFPIRNAITSALTKITALDRMGLFLNPVSPEEVPDYYNIVKNPMDWNAINEKINKHEYFSVQEFKDDISLVFTNAKLYNKPDTPYYRTATRLESAIAPIFEELDKLITPEWEEFVRDLALSVEPKNLDELFKYSFESTDSTDQKEQSQPKNENKHEIELENEQNDSTVEGVDDSNKDQVYSVDRRTTRSSNNNQAGSPQSKPNQELEQEDSKQAQEKTKSNELNDYESKELENASTNSETSSTLPSTNIPYSSSKRTKKQHSEEPVHLQFVDNRSSFKNFETGWILPEGTNRKRRPSSQAATSESIVPPTKRRKTTTSDTKKQPFSEEKLAPVNSGASSELSDVGETDDNNKDSKKDEVQEDTQQNYLDSSTMSTGIINEKLSYRDWEQLRETLKEQESIESVSDDGQLGDGTLVWAKMPGFSEFPAEISEEDDPSIPEAVLKAKKAPDLILVLFFDQPHRSWQWIPRNKLWFLGTNDELDQLFLSTRHLNLARSAASKARSFRVKVRAAYQEATAAMDKQE